MRAEMIREVVEQVKRLFDIYGTAIETNRCDNAYTIYLRRKNKCVNFIITDCMSYIQLVSEIYERAADLYKKTSYDLSSNLSGYSYREKVVVTPVNLYPVRSPKIKKVIFNNPATIVFWSDGTKTVVKADNEAFDKEKGLAMAISKKFMGKTNSKRDYYEVFKKWIPKNDFSKYMNEPENKKRGKKNEK